MATKRLPFPAFLPDQLPRGILTAAINALPAQDGYRPVRSLASISDPLPATFKGGFAAVSTDGTAYLLAGTSNGLARYSGGSWTDLIVGMSVPDRWRFTQFGNFVVGVNGVETKQVDLNAGTASNLTGCPSANAWR